MNFFNFLAAEGEPQGGGFVTTIIMIAAMIAFFYFFIIRPPKKQEKEASDMRNSIQVGDEITTIGGIIGRVVSVKGETVLVETGRDKVKIRFLRSAIKSVDVKAEDAE